jgi:hypothetical protein
MRTLTGWESAGCILFHGTIEEKTGFSFADPANIG